MEPYLNDRLLAIEAKIDQNQKIISEIRRSQKIANYTKILYWGFFILAGLGAFYFVQPFIGQLKDAYGLTGGTENQNSGLLDQLKQFKDLSNTYNN